MRIAIFIFLCFVPSFAFSRDILIVTHPSKVTIIVPRHPLTLRAALRMHPQATILSGTFYDLRTHKPIGAIVTNNILIVNGVLRFGVLVKDGKAALTELPSTLTGITWFIGAGPILVKDGKVKIRSVGVQLSLTQRAPRHALLIFSPERIGFLVSTTPITLTELAYKALRLGAKDAINLDGGDSVNCAVKGRIIKVGRPLTNYFLVLP